MRWPRGATVAAAGGTVNSANRVGPRADRSARNPHILLRVNSKWKRIPYRARHSNCQPHTQAQYQVRALTRALDILNAFSLVQPELSLSRIASLVDLAPSTALRLLSTLVEYGLVEKSPETDRYRIGVHAFELGSIYIQTTTIEAQALPLLQSLARECNQTANLGILDRGEVVHISVVPPDRPIRYYARVGQRESIHWARG